MQFVFNGTLDQFKEHLSAKAREWNRDIVLYQEEPKVLQIGFLRLSHSGGRFFVADMAEENGVLTLAGELRDLHVPIPSRDDRSFFRKIRDALLGFVIAYVLLALIPWAVWALFSVPYPWVSFLIPAAILLGFELSLLLRGRKSRSDHREPDSRFVLFMNMVCSGEAAVPSNTQGLYALLKTTDGLHSLPQIKENTLRWELYKDACVEAYMDEYDTMVQIVRKHVVRGFCTHWHPEREDMYEELYNLGKKGNILVLRKTLSGMQTYYIGEPEKYPFSPSKKRHWGRLIYLEQKD